MTLLHLALARDWDAACRRGSYGMSTLGRTIEQEGFLHACEDAQQLAGVAERFYGDVVEPLVVLHIDEGALAGHGLTVRREPPADGVPELFPHVYGGDLPVDVVREAHPFAG